MLLQSLRAVVFVAFSTSSLVIAATGDCAGEKSERISEKCRIELARLVKEDVPTKALRRTLEAAYKLRACRVQNHGKLEIKYVKDDAVGPVLEVTSFVGCKSKDDVDGYSVSGQYFIDGGTYRFQKLTLSSAE